jgi:hypothetical protein
VEGRFVRRCLLAGVVAVSVTASLSAFADDAEPGNSLPRLGLSPGDPQERSALPATPFGIPPSQSKDYVLDFHGYVLLPLNMAWHKREAPRPGQSAVVIHNPPLIPQDIRRFQYVGVVPQPWVQLNFSYGNSTVAATMILAARQLTDAAGIFNPVDQLGLSDAFLRVNLSEALKVPVEVHVGAYTGRYGAMGEWDLGRLNTPLIARTNTIGESIYAAPKLGPNTTLMLEQGFGGQLGRPPIGTVPEGWNDFADTGVGGSFANQFHVGLSHKGVGGIGLHYITAWSWDDQASVGNIPDGRITVIGADARMTAGRLGHLYAGVAHTQLTNSAVVGGVVEVLNARGGPELIREYLGPNSAGQGSLTTFGGQYDLSVARAVYGDWFKGQSPDLMLSLFGLGVKVKSHDADYDGVTKIKFGAEATYGMVSWFGVGTRFDRVAQGSKSFSILSPRLLFHTDWYSRDQFVIQYSHFTYDKGVEVETGYPAVDDPTANPDKDVLSIMGSFWW